MTRFSTDSLRARLAPVLRALWSDGKGPILLTVSGGWFLAIGVRIVYPALLPDIMSEFRLEYTGAGFLLSAIWVSYGLVQFPGGLLADRFGERAVMFLSMLSTVGAVLAMIFAPAFAVFVLASVILGLGTGIYGTTRVTILSDVYPNHRTTAVSFSQASGNVGNAVLPVVSGLVAVAFGWRAGFGYLLPLFFFVVAGVVIYVPDRTSAEPDTGIGPDYVRELTAAVTTRATFAAALVLFFLMLFYQGVTGFLPSYLIEVKGLTQSAASVLYGSFFIAAIAFQFFSGIVADRLGEPRAITVFSLLGLLSVVSLPFVYSRPAVILLALGSSAVLGAIPPAHTHAVALLPEAIQGSGYGLIRTAYIGLAAASLPLVGAVADAGYFNYVFFLFGAIVVCAAAISLLISE
jgi:MFS family permease